MSSYSLCPLHTKTNLISSCEKLLIDTCRRTIAGRLELVESTKCTGLPCSLVLVEHREETPDSVVGHVRLVPVINAKSTRKAVYYEMMCINRSRRGCGLGKKLLNLAEEYAVNTLGCGAAFLFSTSGKAGFYENSFYEQLDSAAAASLETMGGNHLEEGMENGWNGYTNYPLPGWENIHDDRVFGTGEVETMYGPVVLMKKNLNSNQ